MLSDTRAVQRRLSTQNAPTQLRDDLSAMVGTLVQLRDLTGEGVEATAGFGTRDRCAAMDPMQLSQELNRLVPATRARRHNNRNGAVRLPRQPASPSPCTAQRPAKTSVRSWRA